MRRTTAQELSAALAHEQEHVRGRDPLRTLSTDTSAARFFVAPLLAHLREAFATRELAADRCAVSRCGTRAVAGALSRAH
ncbi:hypothetical protein [Streptomyces sp. NPDC053560]|uniref:hypothetical protein n=1 Tax=Streptomyces sp. NPDC053560 TaxID=3365711 RepID=UPI0037D97321